MVEKLKSRKFWLTFGALVVMLFAEQLGISLSWETIAGVVSTVTGYNIGQGYADGQKAKVVGVPGLASAISIRPLESARPTPDPDA